MSTFPPGVADVDRGVTDYARDNIWVWNTSTGAWQLYKYGPVIYHVRAFSGSWFDLVTGAYVDRSDYALPAGFYAITQTVIDGATSPAQGYEVAATSLNSGNSSFVCRLG